MKIDSGAGHLFASQRAQVNLTRGAESPSSFAAALVAKTQPAQAAQGVQNYDFSNMSPQELKGVMNDLVGSGRMSFDESSSLLGLIPSPLSKVNYDGGMPDSFYQPLNLFTKIQEGIEGAISRNEKGSAENSQLAFDTLMRLQGEPAKVNVQA